MNTSIQNRRYTFPLVAALFTSSFLMSSIQPLAGKSLLPLFGGAPIIWNTCLVFFQAMVVFSYAYICLLNKVNNLYIQAVIHIGLIVFTFFYLPIAFILHNSYHAGYSSTVLWLLKDLLFSIGAPLFIVCSTAPILQMWFTKTKHPDAKDPYYLYTTSNIGSIAAIIFYPFVIDYLLTLNQQTSYWTGGYVLLVISLFAVLTLIFTKQWLIPFNLIKSEKLVTKNQEKPLYAKLAAIQPKDTISIKTKLIWVTSTCIPSSLLLGVSTSITTDVAPMPLLWVLPLGLYLLTFILAFAKKQIIQPKQLRYLHIYSVALYLLGYKVFHKISLPWTLIIQLFVFFTSALMCHQVLVRNRPPVAFLPIFYLWMAIGGLLGGLCNTFLFPKIFVNNIEYTVVLVLACFWHYYNDNHAKIYKSYNDIFHPLILGICLLITIYIFKHQFITSEFTIIIFSLLFIFIFMFDFPSPTKMALTFLVLLFTKNQIFTDQAARILHQERSFFGIHKVIEDESHSIITLHNGNILHGMQARKLATTPLTSYYAPLQDVFAQLDLSSPTNQVGVVGLGVGTIACHARLNDIITFYEIDPAVVKIATNQKFFTYLQDCPAKGGIVLGDGRVNLAKVEDNFFDLLILDAYNSDAIPIHLITKEAVELYLRKLKPNGILAFHTSNRFLNLKKVLLTIANTINVQLIYQKFNGDLEKLRHSSEWVLLAHKQADLSTLKQQYNWQELSLQKIAPLWTDGYSNILSILF